MKKTLKIVLPLLFGIGILVYFLSGFSREQFIEVKQSIAQANPWLILLSVLLGVLSHIIRALRWEYLLEPMVNKKLNKLNLIFAVGLSYLLNLGIPRSGEIARALTLTKYEKLPFAKVMGTIIAERAIDLILLGFFILLSLSLEWNLFLNMLRSVFGPVSSGKTILFLAGLGLFTLLLLFILHKSQTTISKKIKGFLGQIITGFFSIIKSKNKMAFLFQTLVIWGLYLLMLYVVMLAFEETRHLGLGAVLLAFVAGSISIVLSNGGIGTYPVFVTEVLVLYGVSREAGFAFSITMWTAQTLILILFGLISMAGLQWVNQKTLPKPINP